MARPALGDLLLRIHFSHEDLMRTCVARGPQLMWEVVLSAHVLQTRSVGRAHHEWRAQVLPALGPRFAPLLQVNPPRSYFPDFLTPTTAVSDELDACLDEVLAVPRKRIREELAATFTGRRPTADVAALAAGGAPALRNFGALIRDYHSTALAPHWPTVMRHIEADRAHRARVALDSGLEALLASFQPFARWSPPVLEVDYPVEQDLHLDGRGLLLVPSYFCERRPISLADPELPPVLVYPVQHAPLSEARSASLAALVGPSRAAVLGAVQTPCTTSELSRRAAVSLSSASQHATVLREAGLITTRRAGSAVEHSLTALGAALLRGE